MTTLLTRDLSRKVLIEGAPFKVTLSQTGVRITEKGRRKGLEVSWDRLLVLGQPPKATPPTAADGAKVPEAVVADVARDVKAANKALARAVETLARSGDIPAALLASVEPDPVHGRIREQDDWFIEPLLTADELASILRVSKAVAAHLPVRSLMISGEKRFRQSEVRDYLMKHEQPPPTQTRGW